MGQMLAYEIHRNGKRLCVTGLNGDCVLSTIVTHVEGPGGRRLNLHVGGLITAAEEHVIWRNTRLKLGDEVKLRIVEADGCGQAASPICRKYDWELITSHAHPGNWGTEREAGKRSLRHGRLADSPVCVLSEEKVHLVSSRPEPLLTTTAVSEVVSRLHPHSLPVGGVREIPALKIGRQWRFHESEWPWLEGPHALRLKNPPTAGHGPLRIVSNLRPFAPISASRNGACYGNIGWGQPIAVLHQILRASDQTNRSRERQTE